MRWGTYHYLNDILVQVCADPIKPAFPLLCEDPSDENNTNDATCFAFFPPLRRTQTFRRGAARYSREAWQDEDMILARLMSASP